MRKNLIAMSVATLVAGLGLAGGAAANVLADNGAATVSPTNATAEVVTVGGIGHQLIMPYFTTQAGNATLINIVNTDTVNGKAVKVRFRGAANSDDIFDFQLFLSPGDHWSANVSAGSDGISQLTTTDTSCTLPPGVGSSAGNKAFVLARLQSSLTGDALNSQTREGYIEVFNMADIPPKLAVSATGPTMGSVSTTNNPLFTAIKHVSGKPPCTGDALITNLQSDPASLTQAYDFGFRAPSGTLFGNWTIINVPKSGAASGEFTSIAAQNGAQPGFGNIVFFPQTPTSPVGGADLFTADPSLRTVGVVDGATPPAAYAGGSLPIINPSNFDLPDLSTPYLVGTLSSTAPVAQAEALTRALATTSVINEFLTEPSITAKTDWVFSMPTRRYSVALDYRLPTPVRAFTTFPQHDFFLRSNTSVKNGSGGSQICTATGGLTFFDREEGTQAATGFVISPNTPSAGFLLCGEVSVLTFNTPTDGSVLGSTVASTSFSTQGINSGWAKVSTPGLTTGNGGAAANVNPPSGNGLPILGKAFSRASNPAVSAGIAANFGASWEHRDIRPVNP